MGAGILPVSFNGMCMVFLLGREKNNQWSDFGGSPSNKNEPRFNTAIREGYEELSGLLGTQQELKNLVNTNYISSRTDTDGRYTTFMFNIEYDENLPLYFNRNYEFVKNTTPSIVDIHHNGLYEKKEIGWFSAKEICNLELRPFYRDIIFPIINNNLHIKNIRFITNHR